MPDRTAGSRGRRFLGWRPPRRRRWRSSRSSPDPARGSRSLGAETAHRLNLAPVRLYLLASPVVIPSQDHRHAVGDPIDAVERLARSETERVAAEQDVAQSDAPLA